MGNRRERALGELYDATEQLSQPKITPVLQGTCRIQGPVDEYDYEFQGTNSGHFPVEAKWLNVIKDPHTRVEPGACNLCSAPCSSCLHFNRPLPLMESKVEGGPPDNIFSGKEGDNCSCIAASCPAVKSRECDKQKNAFSETIPLLSYSSSHDSSLENAESKEIHIVSVAHDTSENVVLSHKVILDAAEENNCLQEPTSSTTGSPCSAHGSKTSDLHQTKTSGVVEENQREMYYMDDNSHIYGLKDANGAIHSCPGELDKKVLGCNSVSTDSKNDEKAIQKEAAYDNNNSEVEENQTGKGNGKSSIKNSNISSLRDDVLCHKADGIEDPPPSNNVSTKAQSPSSGSLKGASLCQCPMDDEKSLIMGKPVVGSITGKKDVALDEVSTEDRGKSQPQLVSSKCTDECLGAESGDNSKFQPHEAVETSTTNEQADKSKSNSQLPQKPLQPNSECEVSTEIEDDVKVCDICGDAGVEEFLAVCSRCTDGAEHTYCMRIRLDKVPEGEWLCEECQLKEAQSQMIGRSEAQIEAIEAPCSNENSQSTGNTTKSLPCVENKTTDPDIRRDNKELGNLISSTMGDNVEVTSGTKEKFSEACGASTGATFPRKPPLLSRENSTKKPDLVKVKPPTLETPSVQSGGISHPGARPQTSSDSDSSKLQNHIEPTRGSLHKSVSFNNSKVPKVKQLLENIPHRQKVTRESNSSSVRKEGPQRTIAKSSSFRNESSGISNVETINKVQSPKPSQSVDPKGVKQLTEKSAIDRKNSTSDRTFVSPSVSATTVSSVKGDPKIPQYDPKLRRKSDSGNLGNNKGLNEGTGFVPLANEVKKQPSSSLSQTSGSTSSIRSFKNEDQKPSQLVPKAAELMHRDDKNKEYTFLSSSRQAAPVGNRQSHCQKCHEMGHATQFCSVNKVHMSAMKLSSERSLRDMDNRSNKWKDAVEMLTMKSGTKRAAKSPDQSEEVSLSSADVNSEATSKDFPSCSLSSRNLSSVKGAADSQDFSKAANSIRVKQKMEEHKKDAIHPRKGAALDTVDDLNMRPIIQTLPDQVFIPMSQFRASVIPELDCIWQGTFEVLRTAKPPALFYGFQAHLSTYVSPKALEVVAQFPCRVQLQEVPRLSSWPFQFHENSPQEDNIALFFFAKDIESYEKYYWKLLENMLKNDLALKGNIDAVELLIFPSNVLPENSQRWNKLFYLWGVFRGRKENSFAGLPGLDKKPYVSNLNLEPVVQELPASVVSGLCSSHDLSDGNSHELSRSGKSPKVKAFNSSACTDCQDIPPSGNGDGILKIEQPPLVQKTLHQAVADEKALTEQTSCSPPARCSFTSMSQLPNVPVAYPEPKVQIDIEQLPPETENELIELDKLASDSGSRKDSEHHVHASSIINNCEDPTCSVSLNCRQGNDRSTQKIKQKDNSVTSEAILDNQLPESAVKVDHLSWEMRPNRKRAEPSSVEIIKNSCGHMLKSTADLMPWKDEGSCTSLNDEKEHKKKRLDKEGHAASSSRIETPSSRSSLKMQQLPSGFMNDSVYCESISENSKNAERYLFPVDLGPATTTKADNLIYVLSSDDEDSPESKAPDLELALGGKMRPPKQDTLPLLSPKVGETSNRDNLPAPEVDDGDDTLASLSLSLAFPASEKARTAKPISQAEQHLPDKPCISTSFLLFGGYRDT